MSRTVQIVIDLRAIEDLHQRLEARAIDIGKERDGILGGDAMVSLAPVASLDKWTRRNELSHDALATFEDPDELWPPFQLLAFWSEQWRTRLGQDHDDPRWRPTLVSEAAFLRNPDVLAWAEANEPHYEDFAADIANARRKLENTLHEGDRDQIHEDITCLVCDTPLRRRMALHGYEDDWYCSGCHTHLTKAQYNLAASDHAREAFGFREGA